MRRLTLVLLAAGLPCAAAIAASLRAARPDGPVAELARARPGRSFPPRLSIETEYRRCTPLPAPDPAHTVAREECGHAGETRLDLDAFAAAGDGFDPDSLRAAALAGVLWWDERETSLNDAVSRLNRALRLSSDPVPLLVDLSAVHQARAQRTQNSMDLVEGLAYAQEALSHAPRDVRALFNTALALDALEIEEEARRAWNAYLAVDSTSRWADEARRRRAALLESLARARPPGSPRPGAPAAEVAAFAARYRQEARVLGWDTVLARWGQAVQAEDSAGAASQLALAERLGAGLEARGGDRSLADAVRSIRAAAPDPSATAALAEGHRRYAAGQVLLANARHEESAAAFARVIRARPPAPLLHSAELGLAATMVQLLRPERVDAILGALQPRIDRARHPALEARARWLRGTRLVREPRYPEARAEYQAARAIYQRLGEAEFTGAILSMESETAHLQGDAASAYTLMHRTLRALRGYRGSVRLHNQLMVLANWATLDGMPSAAPRIQDEGVSVARRTGKPLNEVEALMARANVRAVTGDTSGARRDLVAAARLAEQVTDSGSRELAAAALRVSRAAVRRDEPGTLAMLDSAVHYFDGKSVWWLLRALLQRADVRSATGDLAGATTDLDTFTARIRGLSAQEDAPLLRAAMIEQARARFDQLVMLHLRAGRTADALRALERGRVSFDPVRDARARGNAPLTAPRGEVAVEYALIGDTLLAWTLRADTLGLVRTPVDRREFLRVAEQVGAALEAPGGEAAAAPGLRRLYDWLIRPIRPRLGGRETPLVILADGEVAGVPFPALMEGGRYLVHDHPLRFAPTLADAARPRPARDPSPFALLVADPAFDAVRHATLDGLKGAEAEARSLQALYPRHLLLADSGATVGALTRGARSARVIHYAGHAVFDDVRPDRSFLVLADRGPTGQLTADTIASLRLEGVRLVVLSACRTLRSREGRSGGFAGLSGALLAAGAGGVVGSLWEVDDRRTHPLMVAFHRAYLVSGDPAAALRQAQLQMLASADPALRSPATWAGFRYAGR